MLNFFKKKYVYETFEVDITKPPLPPPMRMMNAFGETKESIQNTKNWYDYNAIYSKELEK